MSKIKSVGAREILDSRGNPTIEVEVFGEDGFAARAIAPSGASVGTREAVELRDNDPKRFNGKGVLKAVEAVNSKINTLLAGQDFQDQQKIDAMLIECDGTVNKSALGANAIVATSMSVLKAAAQYRKLPLFQFLNPAAKTLPIPMINIINGGVHADNKLDIQEFMIAPVGATSLKEAVRMASEVFHSLKALLKKKNLSTAVGDEGGFAPDIKYTKEALELLLLAIDSAGYKPGKDFMLALDVASSELYQDGVYNFHGENKKFKPEELIKFYQELVREFPIYSLEDPMAENDHDGWRSISKSLRDKVQLVGDDLFVTNSEILSGFIAEKVGNAVLIKPNQVGTITETLDTIKLAHKHNYNCIMSHRSGESEDTTIAHLAVAMGCSQVKFGSVCRVDRTAKYNELIRIEDSLGKNAEFARLTSLTQV